MACRSCGAVSHPGDRFCAGCGASANPGAHVASIGRRAIAAVVDLIVCWSAITLIVIFIPTDLLREGFRQGGTARLIPIRLCSLGLVYYVLCEALFGATIGKIIVEVQVRGIDGNPCNLRSALVRNLLRPVDGIAGYLVGFLAALLSNSRQRLGDLVAGTIVVRSESPAAIRVLLALAWFALASGTFAACQVIPRR